MDETPNEECPRCGGDIGLLAAIVGASGGEGVDVGPQEEPVHEYVDNLVARVETGTR